MALHSYFQDSSLQHNSCCAFAFCVGTLVSLPLISTGSAAVPIYAEVWVWRVAILVRKLGLQQLSWKFYFSKAAYCMSHLCSMQASEARLNTHFHVSGFGEYIKTVLFNVALSCAVSLVSMATSQLTWAAGLCFSALTVWTQFSLCSR